MNRPAGAGRGLAAIVVTSLIFAAVHGPQWPAPIALFILSVVIGYVYQTNRKPDCRNLHACNV